MRSRSLKNFTGAGLESEFTLTSKLESEPEVDFLGHVSHCRENEMKLAYACGREKQESKPE